MCMMPNDDASEIQRQGSDPTSRSVCTTRLRTLFDVDAVPPVRAAVESRRSRSRQRGRADADSPAVPAIVAESVPCLKAAPPALYARCPVILAAHVAPSTHVSRDPNDQGYGDCGRVPAHPDRYARYPCAATRQGLGVPVDVVQLGTEVRLAPSSPPRTPR